MKNQFQFNFRIRFNLARKYRFMWQIWEMVNGKRNKEAEEKNLDPSTHIIIMKNCYLYNNPNTARKIQEGADKTTCAYIQAEEVHILETPSEEARATVEDLILNFGEKVSYNPKKATHWVHNGENADGKTFKTMYTYNREVYILKSELNRETQER